MSIRTKEIPMGVVGLSLMGCSIATCLLMAGQYMKTGHNQYIHMNGLPLDINVYDAALWSSIAPLSEWSVAHNSNAITVPDFTAGSWKTNKPVDILLQTGGTTKVLM